MELRTIIVMVALFMVVAVLLTGVIGMARGGEFNEKYGNKLMVARVTVQLFAVAVIGFLVLVE
jgi:hypothetical protein